MSLGKEPSDISATELNSFIRGAAQQSVVDKMTACMKGATDSTARDSCKTTEAKAALAKALGKEVSEISDTELNRFLANAAKDQVMTKQCHFCCCCLLCGFAAAAIVCAHGCCCCYAQSVRGAT